MARLFRDRRALRWTLLDGLWLVGLAIYVLAGVTRNPFHGDEATQIFMSHDYYYVIQQQNPELVRYTETPPNASEQELRIINGTINKMLIGFAWDMDGMTVEDVNQEWIWGFDDPSGEWDEWTYNHTFNHAPSDRLLDVARIPSALLTAFSVWVVFVLGGWAGRGRVAAWAASFIYATNPAVLINGQRAMMEGTLLFFTALAVLAAVGLARAEAARKRWRTRLAWYALFGAAVGLAIASKHNAGVTVAAVGVAALGAPVARRLAAPTGGSWRERLSAALRRVDWRRHLGGLIAAAVLSLAVFLALNPAWWGEPWAMPSRVLERRTDLLDRQVEYYGGYQSADARIQGLLDEAFFGAPQYYEVGIWGEWIADQIDAYESAGLAGRPAWVGLGAVLVAFFAFGLVDLAERWGQSAPWVVLVWLVVTAALLLALTPFAWQRYYLPLQAPVAVVAGVGVWRVGLFVRWWWARARRSPGA